MGWPRRNFAKILIYTKLEWMGYRVAKKAWQYIQPFWYSTSVWQTDNGRTDVQPISITCFSIAFFSIALLFICAFECLGYYWIKWIATVTMQLSESDLSLCGHTYVTPLFDSLTHDALLEFSPCLNQPLPQLNHIPGYTLMHHVQDAIIHNLGQDCRVATC